MEDARHFDPVAWINTPRWQASRLGLSRMVDLLERLGRPQDELRFVHVAGTNGKGSVCAYVASVLQAAGYKVGLFTSPFILCFEERIRVNGENITGEELARAVAAVRPAAEAVEAASGDHPTEFELMGAVAFEHFRAVGCDIVVLEVGLGGRLDATNVIEAPEVSVICRIGLDHTDLLGDTLGAVAGEKAGIVKAGAPVVSWPQESEAMAVIEAVAAERGCELFVPDFGDLSVEPLAGAALRRFSWKGRGFETRLLGSYQPFNAALALAAVDVLRGRGWAISAEAAFAGIASARWPGRFEGGYRAAYHCGRWSQPPGGRGPGRLARRSSGGGGTRLSRLCFGRAGRQGLPDHGARRGAVGPQLLGVRPEKPSRPGGRRAGGLRARDYGGRGPGR